MKKKIVALLKAKAGMTRDQFVERYETKHVPLISTLLPFFTEYRRSYPVGTVRMAHMPDRGTPDLDVITELWFDDPDALERLDEAMSGASGEAIVADERDQFDRSRMLMFEADERVTPPAELRSRPAGAPEEPPIRTIGLLRKRPGMTRDEFITYYETGHARLALRLLRVDGECVFARYNRTFPEAILPIGEGALPASTSFDVMTNLWFWTQEDYQAFLDLCAQPDIAKTLQMDEAQLFDREAGESLIAKEYITGL